MAKKPDELLRRPLYVYDLPEEVLSTLLVKEQSSDSQPLETPDLSTTPLDHNSEKSNDDAPGSQTCALCSVAFADVQDQRSHFKSDFHQYNLKQKLRGAKPVAEIEFEKLIGDLDESLSGSQSDEDEEDDEDSARKETTLSALLKKQATLSGGRPGPTAAGQEQDDTQERKRRGDNKPPVLWFSSAALPPNNYFGIYRTILNYDETNTESKDVVKIVREKQLKPISLPKPGPDGSLAPAAYKGPHFFLCMIGGGHFAAMVVSLAPRETKHGNKGPMNREAVVLAHKTFHRYTTRRKQGGSQSANDNAKGNAHSAGSSIRRYNEQALIDEIRLLLQEWKGMIDTSELLFIRASGVSNRRTLYGPYEGQVLQAKDPRIRSFPFNTRRPTQNELMRSFIELTRLKVKEIDPAAEAAARTAQEAQQSKAAAAAAAAASSKQSSKPESKKLTEEEETAQLHTSQLQAFIRRSKLPALLSYLKNNELSPDFAFQPADAPQNHHAPTPLHLAAHQGSAALVSGLLLKGGADPTVIVGSGGSDGKTTTAFQLAADRATRDAFRVARDELGEDRWDWEAAGVPAPLKRGDVEARQERERVDAERKEAERRKGEEERLSREDKEGRKKTTARPGRGLLDSSLLQKTAQEKREEEARGLTPEQRMKLDRERRARAAEERMRRLQGGGG